MMVILMIMKRKRMMRWGRITSTTSTPMLENDFTYHNEDHDIYQFHILSRTSWTLSHLIKDWGENSY